MRFSDQFALELDQGQLDFVDIDTTNDVPVYIDPRAIRNQRGEWSEACEGLLQSYFHELLVAIKAADKERIAHLVRALGSEPNETHLGQSVGPSRGRGIGPAKRAEIVNALASSAAAKTGLLQDLEETALFIRGIDRDFVSDMTTSIIRGPLISYTQDMCELHGVEMSEQWSGWMWDPDALDWVGSTVLLPRGPEGKLILVPKSIVRSQLITNFGTYYRDYLRPLLVEEEMDANSSLVQILKDKRKRVYFKDVAKKYGDDKAAAERETQKRPQALEKMREGVSGSAYPPYTNPDFEERTGAPAVDFEELLEPLGSILPGRGGATSYHRAAAAILTAVFDAAVGNMRLEAPLHGGRKRLDIRYDNIAPRGFFHWLAMHYDAATIVVECKNYAADPANPELDQLIGRFSNNRGRIGFLVCRSISDRALFEQRCRDTAVDGNGFIIALDDADLRDLAHWAKENAALSRTASLAFPMLRERFGALIGEA
ncbi:hypothetical protein [Curtobacterium sp. MCBD17_019]|uniref:hypothetical protein n=1 Tax=Curtobacterium sp. MCBD17_019 TaxID=2175669 RepID=UPI0011B492D4|nr:hypothetical protein [Curtobacterium sp. MCBD17_019]